MPAPVATIASIAITAFIGYALYPALHGTPSTVPDNDAPMAGMMNEMSMTMSPDPVPVPDNTPIPGITITNTIRDEMGAYSVQVALTDFTITPEKIDQDPVPNEGHLHVYVDGQKVGREYAEWIYIPASYFNEDGPHRITVSLNANTHGAWTFADSAIETTSVVD